jgi:hypothetical protein
MFLHGFLYQVYVQPCMHFGLSIFSNGNIGKCILDAQVVNYQNIRILTSGKSGLSKNKNINYDQHHHKNNNQ